eukprot:4262867-Prymnesium_polylepis.1
MGALALLHFRSTVFQSVLSSSIFWFVMLLHGVFLYCDKYYLEYMPELSWSSVQPPISLATFFLVFYAGNCYSRFYELHGRCISILGAILDWTSDVKLYFPGKPVRPRS